MIRLWGGKGLPRPQQVIHRARPPPALSNYTRQLTNFAAVGHAPFSKVVPPKQPFNRRWLLLIPFGGGLFLFLKPQKSGSPFPALLSSPTIIPSHKPRNPHALPQDTLHPISSISEPHPSILDRIVYLLQVKIYEPLRTATRFVHLFVLFMPVIITSPMLLVGAPVRGGENWGAIWWYEFLVRQMQYAGPTFIKLAQWAGSRVDLFPHALCEKLGTLHSTTKPHSFRHTKRSLERVFGCPFEEIFEEFDEEPIGSGAIAQVYRATLRKDLLPPSYLDPKRPRPSRALVSMADKVTLPQPPPPVVPGAAVAIKVLHPHVDKMISRDLKIMSFFANCINWLPGAQWLSLPEEVEVFGAMMSEQLDLRHEAGNLLHFEANFNHRRENAVSFPRPLLSWSAENILVEEFENALPLKAFLRNGAGPYDHILATLGLDAFLNMLLLDNFVHSDLHPGNIMVKFYKPTTTYVLQNIFASLFGTAPPDDPTINGSDDADAVTALLRPLTHSRKDWLLQLEALSKEGYQPELVFLDAGLVTVLNDLNRKNFLDLFRAIAEFDGYRAGKLMIERCRTPDLAIDTETFALKMQHLVLSVKAKTFSLGQIKISDILTEVMRNVQSHHVKMEGDFINTVISILLLEGIGRQLDPDMDLFKSALPILRKLGRKVSPKEVADLPAGSLGPMLKLWVWIEARELAYGAFGNADDFVRYDWLAPNV